MQFALALLSGLSASGSSADRIVTKEPVSRVRLRLAPTVLWERDAVAIPMNDQRTVCFQLKCILAI